MNVNIPVKNILCTFYSVSIIFIKYISRSGLLDKRDAYINLYKVTLREVVNESSPTRIDFEYCL